VEKKKNIDGSWERERVSGSEGGEGWGRVQYQWGGEGFPLITEKRCYSSERAAVPDVNRTSVLNQTRGKAGRIIKKPVCVVVLGGKKVMTGEIGGGETVLRAAQGAVKERKKKKGAEGEPSAKKEWFDGIEKRCSERRPSRLSTFVVGE